MFCQFRQCSSMSNLHSKFYIGTTLVSFSGDGLSLIGGNDCSRVCNGFVVTLMPWDFRNLLSGSVRPLM